MDHWFEHTLDAFFSLVATDFRKGERIDEEEAKREQESLKKELSRTLARIREKGSLAVVRTIQDMSFTEILHVLSIVEKSVSLEVLDLLHTEGELRAALEFGLQYEARNDRWEEEVSSSNEQIRSFLDGLKKSEYELERSPMHQSGLAKRFIDVLTKNQIQSITNLDEELANRIVLERSRQEFSNLLDLKGRIENLTEDQLRLLARFF